MPAMVSNIWVRASAAALWWALSAGAGTALAQSVALAPNPAASAAAQPQPAPLNLPLPRAASAPGPGALDKLADSPVRPYGSGYEARGLGGSSEPAMAASGAQTGRSTQAEAGAMNNRSPSMLQRYGAGGGGRGRGRR